MKDKLHPIFIDLCIGDKYIIRLVRTDEKIKGEYTYALKGTPKDIEALQADINDVFPQNRT